MPGIAHTLKRSLFFAVLLLLFAFAIILNSPTTNGSSGTAGGTRPENAGFVSPSMPPSSVLNGDGAIRPGSLSSFDPKGFRMAFGLNGEPRFFLKPGRMILLPKAVARMDGMTGFLFQAELMDMSMPW